MKKFFWAWSLWVGMSTLADNQLLPGDLPFPKSIPEFDELFKTGERPDAKLYPQRTVYKGTGYHIQTGRAEPAFFAVVEAPGEEDWTEWWLPGFSAYYVDARDFFYKIEPTYLRSFPTVKNDFVTVPRPAAVKSGLLYHAFHFRVIKNDSGLERVLLKSVCYREAGCPYSQWVTNEVCVKPFLGKPKTVTQKKLHHFVVPYGETVAYAIFPHESGEFISINLPDKPSKPQQP